MPSQVLRALVFVPGRSFVLGAWCVSAARAAIAAVAFVVFCAAAASAHDGPPFPIVSDRVAGAYRLSIWTDPDATDDGSAGGQFWLVIEAADRAVALPADTRGRVSIAPIGHEGTTETGPTTPVSDAGRQFVALRIDREGRYAVRAEVEGPLGPAVVEGDVDATYDLRPPPALIAVYLMPFVLAGALWLKVLVRRRAVMKGRRSER